MEKKILSLIMVLFIVLGWAQNASEKDYSVSINGNKISTTANFKQQVKEIKNSTSKKQIPKREYTLVQFTKMPSIQEQQKLKKQGVNLLSYLSNNAYYVAIDSEFYSKGAASDNIRAIITIDPKYKLDQMLANSVIPDYALEGNNIKVVISYFKGVNPNDISKDLTNIFVKGIKIEEPFSQIYLQVSKEKLDEIAKFNWVQNIDLIPPPVESDNKPGVTSHKANVLGSTIPGLGYGLTGKGVKVGIWDGNLEEHKDHTGRVTIKEYESNSSHGEHVSGTIGGAGLLDPIAKGMAPEVKMYGWNFNTQSNGLSVASERLKSIAEDGIEITSNSYGILISSGYNTYRYNGNDYGDDYVTAMNPYLLNIYSNGNAQTANLPSGFNTSTKNSKNSLHVAANDPNDLISNYSSFGPTIDGRLVPQIAAVGTDVYSLDYSNSYQVMSGTSMATPGTTGTVALLYERYKNIYGEKPLASLMKALVTNTAKDVGNPGPDYKYGFGNLNGLRAVKVLDKKMFYTGTVSNGASVEKQITVPAGLVSLKVMLAYSDLPGTLGAGLIQVNDLDIKVVKDGVTILPWVLNPTTPGANAVRGVDTKNNIEQVTLDNPAPGTYKIIVTGTEIPLDSQEFSVVYDFVAPELILTYPMGGEKFNPDTTEYIRWDYEGEPKTFTVEYSVDGGINYATIAKDVPATARNFEWKVPSSIVANAKIRVSAGSKVSTSKEIFNIIAEPKNLVIAPSVCGTSSYKMDWDPIVGAKYEVLKLNGYKFDVVATVTDPTYTFNNLTVSEDNWFSVRTVDIATGIVSERVRAVNVEPVSQPVLNALSLPFVEDFNNRKATNYVFSKGSTGDIKYEYINAQLLDGVKMQGSNAVAVSPWVASTETNAFINNLDYIKKVSFCDIDATSLTGKNIKMTFNLLWNSVGSVNKNFFRVLVNGSPISSHLNKSVYGGTQLTGNAELTYDLSAYAGTTFSVVFEAVSDNDVIIANNDYVFNSVSIDNINFFEASGTDLKLTSLIPNAGFTATEVVKIKVFNNSPVAISDIPVSYKINGGAEVIETIAGPVNPLSEISYDFVQTANFLTLGKYTVVANVNYTGDQVTENNTMTKVVYNSGTDVLMGSVASITTCSSVFTDSGTRYDNYGDGVTQTITFIPLTAGNSINVNFSNFDLEADYDFMYVYNGANTSAPLLGKYTGNTLPPSLTSTAAGGELTFRFVSDEAVNEKGWIADITCVAKPVVNDVSVVAIVKPEIIGKKSNESIVSIRVSNLGSVALIDYPVFYQVNEGEKVTGVVPSIPGNGTVNFTFPTKADLSIVGKKYVIKSGTDMTDNSIEKTVYNDNELPTHTNTNGYAISKFKWDEFVNTSGTTPYSDFKNLKIPVYAGFTYQPEATITITGVPLAKDISATNVGVFTMIVIDLNGDGDLTDEFYAGNFWINTVATSPSPAIKSTLSAHYFRNNLTLTGGLTIPANTAPGEKLMRVIQMYRSPNEYYNVNLGPTFDGVTTSNNNFEIEEYTIDVLPFTAINASVEKIVAPIKPGNKPVTVTAVIRNLSNVPISNFPIAYKVNGENEVVQNVVGPIAASGTATVSFVTKADLSALGDYVVDVYTKLVGDTDPANDLKSVTLTHVQNSATNVVGTFDGIDDFVKSDVTPALNISNNYTFEAWINQKESGIYGRILDKGTISVFVHNANQLGTYKENSLVLSIATATGFYYINTLTNSIKQNTWHHIAFTVSITNVYTVYIDGVSVPFTSTGVAGPASTNATSPAYIGNNAGLARGFNGNIDEVRIWTGVRSQLTIRANALTKYPVDVPSLLAYYPFSEGNKQFVFDGSLNDNTGVVTNADTDGIGEGKFWNVPVLLQKIDFVDQISSSYDKATRTFTVLLKDGADITKAVANFTVGMQSVVIIKENMQMSGVTPNDYTTPLILTVEGVGFNTGITERYTIKMAVGLNKESKLISYDFKTASNPGLTQEINTDIVGHNVTKTVPFGVDVSNLIADFTVSLGAELHIDGEKQLNSKSVNSDYKDSFFVTVISEDKLSKTNYTVTLNASNSEASLLSYSVANQVGVTVIDPVSKTVRVYVNNDANLSALIPNFQVSSFATLRIGTYIQNSGVTILNYTLPVLYNVMAQNGTIENWTVIIERAKPTITLTGNTLVSLDKGCPYVEAGYVAKDNLDVDISSEVLVSGIVDVNTPGQYILIYTAKDALQNTSVAIRTINVSSTVCTLGIDTNEIDGFVIYPNPVKDGKVYVQTTSPSPKNIVIADMAGKIVFTTKTEHKELDIRKLPTGVYIIKVEQEGKTATQKLIVE
ncbi:S8 family serine peptidase [Flavobacterium branchiarum]|uniref:S8 family serine peptidase n=1 Tax=Flavobacterium branchiarum TaxID=1114870 RepID=A0ABV5FMN6_9FLAO|nr:S8 family serine peptidase [Flavobacterium branchiarum]MDN3674318.1 S8 family serine peptidase [Flavobacterium branchiarum]